MFSLRYQIYVKEMGRLGDNADHEHGHLRDAYDDTARSIIHVADGKAVGTLRIHWGGDAPFSDEIRDAYALNTFSDVVSDPQMCVAERLMIPAELRGDREVTAGMYVFLYRFLMREGAELIFLDCEPHLINNWLRLGFRTFAPTFTYPGVGLVVPLVGVVWDIEHLKRIGSPLLVAFSTRQFGGRQVRRSGPLKQLVDRLPEPIKETATRAALKRSRTPGADTHQEAVARIRAKLPEVAPVMSENSAGIDTLLSRIYGSLAETTGTRPTVFDDMTEEERARCIRSSHIIECRQGDFVIQRGNAARTLFVLLSGVTEVRRSGEVVAVFTGGEVFGEVSFLLGTPRTADVVAVTGGVRVLSLSDSAIHRLMAKDERLAAKLLLNLCRCLCWRMVDHD